MKLFKRKKNITDNYVLLSYEQEVRLTELNGECFGLLAEMVWARDDEGSLSRLGVLYDFAEIYKDAPVHHLDGFAKSEKWYIDASEKARQQIEAFRTQKQLT